MDWTRSRGARVAALLAAACLVVIHWSDRGTWFWVGAVLLVLNLLGLARTVKGPASSSVTTTAAVGPLASSAAGEPRDGTEVLLAHLDVPEVAAAFDAGPRVWDQVSYLADEQWEPVSWRFIAEHVWLGFDGEWSIGLGDEVKPYLDLDLDPDEDPVLSVLRSHPAVADAWHEDREVYTIEQRAPLTVRGFSELVARALVAHQQHVRGRPLQ